MKISKNTVVSLSYVLSDTTNQVIEDGQEPLLYLHGGYDNIFPKIEEALEGREAGFETTIQLEPEDAFGDYDAALLKVEPRSRFPEALEVGMQFEGAPEEGEEQEPHIFTITDIAEGKVVLDGNHPLAGVALRFALKVLDVREAGEVEVAHGHVHAHGHDHEDGDDHYRGIELQ